ncbi:MAG: DUF3987 domain-containing protein [Mesorhizobium sp.]|uniref:DUF3987 domain-containing protein n=1 Tax=Mesorhizobium sp. TaxID=1871066 RepID=UPI000FE862DA|nr:DUF3987 domain-containing protein [Mesorhizobium sp.]RWM96169.1 MAG: DUF3987 domain-containing protein [Mesorhizobium sp.]
MTDILSSYAPVNPVARCRVIHPRAFNNSLPPLSSFATPVDLWGNFDPPPLPIGLLPPIVEQFATVLASHMGADPAGLAMAALTTCAATISDKVQLQVKHHDPHWKESARIWTALIGLPSTKKSPIINAAVAPLAKIDSRMVRDWQSKRAQWDALDKAERAATPEPLQNRKRIEDTTVEAMQEVMRGSTEGVLCVRDELSGWFGSMEKYAGGKAAATDRAIWLQAFNGGEYAINRIGRGVTLLPNLSVSLLGGIQPDAIRRVAADATDDGLLQRLFPIVLRPATIGRDAPLPPVQAVYEFTILMLNGTRAPGLGLRFDDEAQSVRQKLEARHARLMAAELVNPKLASHIGKLDGLFARLCVVWHAIENVQAITLPGTITGELAGRVADFVRVFLLPHAVAFYSGVLGLSDDADRLKAVAAYIIAHRLPQITVRDVQRGDGAMRKIAKADVLPILEQLTALSWVAEVPGPRATSDPIFIVNPAVHSLFAERGAREAARRDAAKEAMREMFGR